MRNYNYNFGQPALVNVTFSGNTADKGGGMSNQYSSPVLINTILWNNPAVTGGDEIFNEVNSTPNISYSLIEGCGGSGAGWNNALGIDLGNNIDADPMFKGAAFPDSPLALYSSSPCIDAGDGAAVPAGVTNDLAGNPRIYGAGVDMGAYEYQGAPTGIDDGPQNNLPTMTALLPNYPNPFNPTTTISFTLVKRENTNLSVYNIEGKLVTTLVDETLDGGFKEVTWHGKDAHGNPVSTGVYFYRLTAGNRTLTKKMVLLK
jgi:hypothetical protein